MRGGRGDRPKCWRDSGDVHSNAIVTIRFANCARAVATHLAPSGCVRYPDANSGRRFPSGGPFCGAAIGPDSGATRMPCVTGLRHSPRAAVSPARGGIGSSTAAGRSRPGALCYRSASWMRPAARCRSAVAQGDPAHWPAADALPEAQLSRSVSRTVRGQSAMHPALSGAFGTNSGHRGRTFGGGPAFCRNYLRPARVLGMNGIRRYAR